MATVRLTLEDKQRIVDKAISRSVHMQRLQKQKVAGHNELLDSLCNQIVTALGVGYMFGFDMQKALAEVVRSNFSKFENGKPVFDDNGKIKKGANYTPPQLGEFI